MKHERARRLPCIPDSLSVSKLLRGGTEEDINETTVLINSDGLQRLRGIFHTDQRNARKHSVLHKSKCQVFLLTKNKVQFVCAECDRAWLSERLRHLTARRLQFCFQSRLRCVQPGTWRTSVDALRQTPATCLDFTTCWFFFLSILKVVEMSESTKP